jgi:hypothetical protein
MFYKPFVQIIRYACVVALVRTFKHVNIHEFHIAHKYFSVKSPSTPLRVTYPSTPLRVTYPSTALRVTRPSTQLRAANRTYSSRITVTCFRVKSRMGYQAARKPITTTAARVIRTSAVLTTTG